MAGSGGSIKELIDRYNALTKPVFYFGVNLGNLRMTVEGMNENYWNGGKTANTWYEALEKAYKADKSFYNKMLTVQKKLRTLIEKLTKAAKANSMLHKQSGSAISQNVSIQNKSVDDIFIDSDNVLAYSKDVKTILENMCNELQKMKTNLDALVNNPKIKGKVRKAISKVDSGVKGRYNKTKTAKNTLESSLSKSIAQYQEAMNSFDELDTLAEDLGSDGVTSTNRTLNSGYNGTGGSVSANSRYNTPVSSNTNNATGGYNPKTISTNYVTKTSSPSTSPNSKAASNYTTPTKSSNTTSSNSSVVSVNSRNNNNKNGGTSKKTGKKSKSVSEYATKGEYAKNKKTKATSTSNSISKKKTKTLSTQQERNKAYLEALEDQKNAPTAKQRAAARAKAAKLLLEFDNINDIPKGGNI